MTFTATLNACPAALAKKLMFRVIQCQEPRGTIQDVLVTGIAATRMADGLWDCELTVTDEFTRQIGGVDVYKRLDVVVKA